jgi:hypothetical protein
MRKSDPGQNLLRFSHLTRNWKVNSRVRGTLICTFKFISRFLISLYLNLDMTVFDCQRSCGYSSFTNLASLNILLLSTSPSTLDFRSDRISFAPFHFPRLSYILKILCRSHFQSLNPQNPTLVSLEPHPVAIASTSTI